MTRQLFLIILLLMLFVVSAVAIETDSPIVKLRYRPAPFNVSTGITIVPVLDQKLADDISLSYLWRVNGEEVDFVDDAYLSGENFVRGDSISVEVIIDSMSGQEYPPYIPLPVYVDNAPPRFTRQSTGAYNGKLYRGQVFADDPDGDILTYQIVEAPEGFTLDEINGSFSWKPTEDEGVYPITIEVLDPFEGRAVQSFDLTLARVQQ